MRKGCVDVIAKQAGRGFRYHPEACEDLLRSPRKNSEEDSAWPLLRRTVEHRATSSRSILVNGRMGHAT